MPLELDFYYGNEAEQYSFYRIPKALFTDERFQPVSIEAKVLYGLLLDRMGLSIRSGWMDEDGRVYLYFTLEDAMQMLGCGHGKAVKLFSELSADSGIGLIERKKQGQGKPTKIYVKNFITAPNLQTSQNRKSEPPKAEVKTSEKRKSALPESESLDFSKSDGSNTDLKNTEINDKAGLSAIKRLTNAVLADPTLAQSIALIHPNPPPTEHGKDYNQLLQAKVAALRQVKNSAIIR